MLPPVAAGARRSTLYLSEPLPVSLLVPRKLQLPQRLPHLTVETLFPDLLGERWPPVGSLARMPSLNVIAVKPRCDTDTAVFTTDENRADSILRSRVGLPPGLDTLELLDSAGERVGGFSGMRLAHVAFKVLQPDTTLGARLPAALLSRHDHLP